jgi:FAD:protein FMN transferase
MRYHEFRAMSTDILLAAEGPADELDPAFQQIEAFIEACERRFTRFSETSELLALNRSAGTWFSATADMYELISLALRLHHQTRGLFDPSILEALERAGYDRTIDEIRSGGAAREEFPRGAAQPGPALPGGLPVQALSRSLPVHFGEVRLDAALRRIWMPPGMRIDLGGIAKGWIAEQAARRLSVYSRACAVDAGGDAFFYGLPPGEKFWRVTLEDPTDAGQGVAVLKSGPGAVATSTITRRRWQQADQTKHHLIDPRTQLPAETDWLSVTVLARHTAEAEVFAKSLLIGGMREAERLTTAAPDIQFIAMDKNKKLWGSKYSREIIDV